MRKYMNNHFGQSNIFHHARFKVPVETGGEEGGSQEGIGGGAPSQEEHDPEPSGESIESLKAELAKAKADALRFKNSNDKLLKEKGELTKKNREMMSADEVAQEAQKEREQRFAEMEKELRTNKYSKRLVGLGMTEGEADAFAATIPQLEDPDTFFVTLGDFIKAKSKEASDNAIQELLRSRPEINAGNGDSDKDSPAMEFAKRAVEQHKAESKNNNFNSIISNYTH